MKSEVEIIDVTAFDITETPVTTCGSRKMIFMENFGTGIGCFGLRCGGKTIYVAKDLLNRNIKGPERKRFNNW